ncbi:MAG TPA: helicase-associated domain-containing protein [Thermoflexales bacterium]|nr:helicase-associated domain-containing protein [Thermoflexales bacterium]
MRDLRKCLLDEPLARLMAMADAWSIAIEVASPREAAELLAAHMLLPAEAARACADLPAPARDALAALAAARGRMPSAAFERRAGAIRPMGPGRLERERPWLNPENAAETLWYSGFIFRGFDRNASAALEMMYIPTDLLPLLADCLSPDPDPSAEQPMAFERDAAPGKAPSGKPMRSALLDDVTSVLAFYQNGKIRAGKTHPPQAILRGGGGLAHMLRNPDERRMEFLQHLIGQMGWLKPGNPPRLNAAPVMRWLQAPPDEQREALLACWRDDAAWNDLAHADPSLKFEMAHAWANAPARERASILGAWRGLMEAGQAADAAALAAHIKQTQPDFARVDGRYDTWHIRDADGKFLHGFEHWDRIEGALIRYVADGPLRWLEQTETAIPEGAVAPFEVEAEARVRIASHLRFERFQLARVADFVSLDEDGFTYRLTPSSLARAQEQGILARRATEFLERTSGKPLPPSAARAITRWGERGAEARLEQATLLRVKEAGILDKLLDLAEIRKLDIERIAPTLALVRASHAALVQAEAARNGLLVDGG